MQTINRIVQSLIRPCVQTHIQDTPVDSDVSPDLLWATGAAPGSSTAIRAAAASSCARMAHGAWREDAWGTWGHAHGPRQRTRLYKTSQIFLVKEPGAHSEMCGTEKGLEE